MGLQPPVLSCFPYLPPAELVFTSLLLLLLLLARPSAVAMRAATVVLAG